MYYDDKNLNEELLKAELAWHFRRYSKDEKLQAMEDRARADKVGLWQDKNPIPPRNSLRTLRSLGPTGPERPFGSADRRTPCRQ